MNIPEKVLIEAVHTYEVHYYHLHCAIKEVIKNPNLKLEIKPSDYDQWLNTPTCCVCGRTIS